MRETLTDQRLVQFLNDCRSPLIEKQLIQFINKCGNPPTEEQLSVVVAEAAQRQKEKDQYVFDSTTRHKLGNLWQSYVENQVELSEVTSAVVYRQGYATNRAKPIGLFLGNDELVALQCKETTLSVLRKNLIQANPIAYRHKSFIESFWWNAEDNEQANGDLSKEELAKLLGDISQLLAQSSLPNPRKMPIREYVVKRYYKVAENR